MRRTLSLALALVMVVALFGPALAGPAPALRVLVNAADPAVRADLAATHGMRWDFGALGFTTDLPPAAFAALGRLPGVTVELVPTAGIMAKPSQRPGSGTRATPSDQTPWGIEAIYNDPTITATSGGLGVRVAVLDTGVYVNHPDLKNRWEQCKDFTGPSLRDGKCDDKNGHGTHVAGTVLADAGSDRLGIYGVAPEARLWAYKVLGSGGIGFSDDIAAAIRHAADEGARLGVKVVVSMSLGSDSPSGLIKDAIDYAVQKGVLVVAAAGNSGPDPDTIGYPGAFVTVVAVAALENVQENGTYRVADFSSRGKQDAACPSHLQTGDPNGERCIEVAAPGRAIESTWNDGKYNTISGTSMATPHVSGLAARIWAANPGWTAAQVRAELQGRGANNDIKGGLYAGDGYDVASGFGFPLVKATGE